MNPRLKSWLQLAAVLLLVAGAVWFVLNRSAALRRSGEENARVWFYDQSEKKLYAAPSDTVPPDRGIGGKSGDGVRAVVLGFRAGHKDASERRIAYLETYSPALKQTLEEIRSARAAHKKYGGPVPARDSDYFQTNSLVKRPEDPDWLPTTAPEARRIMSEWRSWRGPDGQPPVILAP